MTAKCDSKDEDQLRNSTNSGHSDEADIGIPAKETSAETTEVHNQSRSSPTPPERIIPASVPTLHRGILKPDKRSQDMPRTAHNPTTDSNVPQLQNGHRQRVIHDWHNNYNRIVNWQQAGTRRPNLSIAPPSFRGVIQGDNLWWLTVAIARGTQESRTIYLLHDAVLRLLQPTISRPVGPAGNQGHRPIITRQDKNSGQLTLRRT